MARTESPIVGVLNRESYYWLSTNFPDLIDAVEKELLGGKSPREIMQIVSRHVGEERSALALRVYQAACHLEKEQES